MKHAALLPSSSISIRSFLCNLCLCCLPACLKMERFKEEEGKEAGISRKRQIFADILFWWVCPCTYACERLCCAHASTDSHLTAPCSGNQAVTCALCSRAPN